MTLVNRVVGRYKLERLLGEGGMGAVYLARHQLLNNLVAIKVMHPHFAHQAVFRDRFLREARVAVMLDHPGIVKVRDIDQTGDLLYIVMDFIPGDTMAQLLQKLQRQRQWIPLAEGLQLIWQVSEALDYAHRQGVLHRDIKPGNIMLKLAKGASGERFQAIITDLGLAKLTDGSEQLTRVNASMGTPAYMSPEQAMGEETDARSDIYSVGVLLYELAVGQRPFPIQTPTEAYRYHVLEPPPPPLSLRPELPPALSDVILRALAKKPADRFASAGQLARALVEIPLSTLPETVPWTAPGGVTHLYTQVQNTIASQQESLQWTQIFPQEEAAQQTVDHLQIVDPDGKARTVPLNRQSFGVGREPGNDLVLDDAKLSRQHLRITFDGRNYVVTDLESTNGTRLDNRRLPPNVATPWGPKQVIKIGKHQLRLVRGRGAASSGAERAATPDDGTQPYTPNSHPGNGAPPTTLPQTTPPSAQNNSGGRSRSLSWWMAALVTLLIAVPVVGLWRLLANGGNADPPIPPLTITITAPPPDGGAVSQTGGGGDVPIPADTDTPTPTLTSAPTETETPTATQTLPPTDSPSPTATATLPATETPSPTVTATTPPTNTPVPTDTATPLPTATPTATLRPTDTPTVAIPLPVMVPIVEGSFVMGSDDAGINAHVADCNASEGAVKGLTCDPNWFGDEAPARSVFLNAFQITKFEITNAEYQACVDRGQCAPRHIAATSDIPDNLANFDGANRPVIGVSAIDAENYCRFIGGRLPTEEEWEKAARGTDARAYPWGNSFDAGRANTCDVNCTLPAYTVGSINDGYARTAPVGSFGGGVSPYGVHDMAGNVWEWTASYHSNGDRIIRGGGWSKWFHQSRSAERSQVASDYANFDIGIRCVK